MDEMTLQEAKSVAVLGENAPIGRVVLALDALFLELRKLENERDRHLFAAQDSVTK